MSRRGHLSSEHLTPDESGTGSGTHHEEEIVQEQEAESDNENKYHNPTVAPVYPEIPVESIEAKDDKIPLYEEGDWPTQKECTALTSPDNFPPVFLPPENKGFE